MQVPPFEKKKVFGNGALFTPVVSTLFCVFFSFHLSEFNQHAASILQSIVVNRLQFVLLFVLLSLYLTDFSSLKALNHNQVLVCEFAG